MASRILLLASILLLAGLAVFAKADGEAGAESDASGSENSLYRVEGSVKLPREGRAASARVLLNAGAYVGIVRSDGSFVVHNVPSGSYILEVAGVDYQFAPVRIDISAKDKGRVRATGTVRRERIAYPLQLRPTGKAEYFQKRAPVDWMQHLKSPMVLMMIFTVIMIVVFPRILGNMDPKELEEMKRMQKQMNPLAMLRNAAQNAQQQQ